MRLDLSNHESPLGDLIAAWNADRLCALAFTEHWPIVERALTRRGLGISTGTAARRPLQQRLDGYFAGVLDALDDLPIDPHGTDFQRAVWSALRSIRAGGTVSYGELARRIGAPTAVRAVGAANGANPIWLVIPCHRAIGADGRLTGYAGGLERKRWLLEHEGAIGCAGMPVSRCAGAGPRERSRRIAQHPLRQPTG
jgi:methylated-DNA-[protein]-cysteine S-methyltransferase